jgi:hypothetical protein
MFLACLATERQFVAAGFTTRIPDLKNHQAELDQKMVYVRQ